MRWIRQDVERIPIATPSDEQRAQMFDYVQTMLDQNKHLQALKGQLLQLLQAQFDVPTISRKLENWPELTFKEFLAELTKQKVKPTLSQQAEWMTYLADQQAKARTIQATLDKTEQEIDQLVYSLYGLTDEEIVVVEGKA